ncbi:MAG: hypothetical protein KKA62_00275 [Nanoarchaeota archaeon]|nr:hypothetical protein [Nanoarchaeota archaeon]MBU1644223.1 hypothetical protein [Nanoarchaeota archaeon]MBU1976372.1 hypothetical protein [Nanoarchaeota archaeon]
MKLKKIILALLLTTIFFYSALAAVPTPGSSFSGLLDFFRGIFTGTATMEDAYLISFILYFVLFLAIFMEGIKIIPFFGARGEITKPGKAFAIAAAGLSTIALFIVEQGTQVSTADRISHLTAPFGVWGGVIIATILAYMAFRFIYDTELFKEHVIIAMAIAVAIGVTLAGFLLTMDTLIGWGFLILLLSFLIGLIVALFEKGWSIFGGGSGNGGGTGRGGSNGGGRGGSDDGRDTGGDTGGDEGNRKLIEQILKRLDDIEDKFSNLLEQILAILKTLPKQFKLSGEDLEKIKGLIDLSLKDFKKDIGAMMEKYFDEVKELIKNHDAEIKAALKEIEKTIGGLNDKIQAGIKVLIEKINGLEEVIKNLNLQLKKLQNQITELQEEIMVKLDLIESKTAKEKSVQEVINQVNEIKRLMNEHVNLENEIKRIVEKINADMGAQDEMLQKIYDLLLSQGHVPEQIIGSLDGDLQKINNNIGRAKSKGLRVKGLDKFEKRKDLISLLRKKERSESENEVLKQLIIELSAWWAIVSPNIEKILEYFKGTKENQRAIFESFNKNILLLEANFKKGNI